MNNSSTTDALKTAYLLFLTNDLDNNEFTNIRKLSDAAHITNDLLVQQFRTHSAPIADLDQCVFCEVCLILSEELVNNEELEAYFDRLYYNQFKYLYDGLEKVRALIPEDPEQADHILSKLALKATENIDPQKTSSALSELKSGAFGLLVILIMRNRTFGYDIVTDKMISEYEDMWANWSNGISELNINDGKIVFADGGEPIYSSKMYAKLVRKTKEGIASYLGIATEKLNSYIRNQYDQTLNEEGIYKVPDDIEVGFALTATQQVIQYHGGTVRWFNEIISSAGINRGNLGYKPDVDKLIDLYCRSRVFLKYVSFRNSRTEFTKADLLRECRGESPREDYLALLSLYNTDIVYQMFRYVMELYLRNFSWDVISKQSKVSRLNQIVEELKSVISEKDRTIEDLGRRVEVLQTANNKDLDAERIAMQRETDRLLDIIAQKDQENEQLKEKIRDQDELIDAYKHADETPKDIVVNLEELQKKRYLFVGHTEANFPELNHVLKKNFPNSIYMESETDDIDKIQVDGIVFFINWMSHKMFYKVKATNAMKEVPVVYCNTRNIDRILQDLQEGFLE